MRHQRRPRPKASVEPEPEHGVDSVIQEELMVRLVNTVQVDVERLLNKLDEGKMVDPNPLTYYLVDALLALSTAVLTTWESHKHSHLHQPEEG